MLETRRAAETGASARERILDASYELFSKRGIRGVGVNEVIERAGVATATLYRHFPSKNELVLAFLRLREQRWTKDFVEAGAISRGSDPEQRLLAIFDVFDEWFHHDDFEACSFTLMSCLRWVRNTPRATPASGISSRSARSCVASPRKPTCATPSPSRAPSTSS